MDPFDELAAMFLTAPQPQPPMPSLATGHAGEGTLRSAHETHTPALAHPQRHRVSETEALIVGHMPVRAGLWLAPYADAMARQVGTVGLVRLDCTEPSLQVFRAPEALATAPLRMPLPHTIHDLGGCIDRWILRGSESLGAADILNAAVDRITILSSADEAAVVAAYQTIKDLAQAAEAAGMALPRLGLAIAGADHQAAAAVIDRLNRTTVSFLGVEIELVSVLPRIDAGIKCTRYVTYGTQTPPSMLEVRQWIEQAKAMPWAAASASAGPLREAVHSAPAAPRQAPPPAESQPAVIGRIDAAPETFVHDARRILRQPSAPFASHSAPEARQPTGAGAAPPLDSPARRSNSAESLGGNDSGSAPEDLASFIAPQAVKLPPKVVIEVEHKRQSIAGQPVTIEPDDHGQAVPLARFVAGLTPLPVRSPGHERIEIAVDADGVLHLLARDNALREMPVVERWAHAHRELIAMACPQHRFDPSGRALCHVFAREPISVADLHASSLRLHVLAPVSVGDKTAWYAAPLNVVT